MFADPKIVYGCLDEVLHLFNVRMDEKLQPVAIKQFDGEDWIHQLLISGKYCLFQKSQA